MSLFKKKQQPKHALVQMAKALQVVEQMVQKQVVGFSEDHKEVFIFGALWKDDPLWQKNACHRFLNYLEVKHPDPQRQGFTVKDMESGDVLMEFKK